MQTEGLKVRFSFQEARIAIAICEGSKNSEIAEDLGISEFTVKAHLKEIFDGLNITSRLELCLWGLQHPEALFDRDWADVALHRRGCDCEAFYCTTMRSQAA